MNKQKLRDLAKKATPGEWIVGECYADNGAGTYCGIYNSDGRDVYSEDGISEPDAEYIAAANPATILALLDENAALLEALKGMVQLDREHHQRGDDDIDISYEVQSAYNAIAKAESAP